jgi:hypothetical protein
MFPLRFDLPASYTARHVTLFNHFSFRILRRLRNVSFAGRRQQPSIRAGADGTHKRLDFPHPPRPSLHSGHPSSGGEFLRSPPPEGCPQGGVGNLNPKFPTDYLFGDARGQMFGVLECADGSGNTVVLKAFSCQYDGEWLVDALSPDQFSRRNPPADERGVTLRCPA